MPEPTTLDEARTQLLEALGLREPRDGPADLEIPSFAWSVLMQQVRLHRIKIDQLRQVLE